MIHLNYKQFLIFIKICLFKQDKGTLDKAAWISVNHYCPTLF